MYGAALRSYIKISCSYFYEKDILTFLLSVFVLERHFFAVSEKIANFKRMPF